MRAIAASIAILLVAIGLLVFWVKQPMIAGVGSASVPAVSAARLEAHVRVLSEDLVPRDYRHPENLDRAADYVRKHFEETGGRVYDQEYSVDGATYRNVVLELGPKTGKPIILGAHYDAFEALPAADDNASGVAGVIELASLLSRTNLRKPVHFVAYTLEEPPFFRTDRMGSAVHANSLVEAGRQIDCMISVEMIGYFSDDPGSQDLPMPGLSWLYPTEGHFIAVIGRLRDRALVRSVKRSMITASTLPVYSFNAPPNVLPGIDFSDHLNYWQAGADAVMVTDTSFYRNHEYHTEKDTADRLDYERMADVVAGLYRVVIDRQ